MCDDPVFATVSSIDLRSVFRSLGSGLLVACFLVPSVCLSDWLPGLLHDPRVRSPTLGLSSDLYPLCLPGLQPCRGNENQPRDLYFFSTPHPFALTHRKPNLRVLARASPDEHDQQTGRQTKEVRRKERGVLSHPVIEKPKNKNNLAPGLRPERESD